MNNKDEQTRLNIVTSLKELGEQVKELERTIHKDAGKTLTPDFNAQESYLNGQKVKWGTDGSVRPDFCNSTTCSIEVKNYDIQNNINGLIDNVSKQAIERKEHLPPDMEQTVVIDIRGQKITAAQKIKIKDGIESKSNGIIKLEQIRFLTDKL